MEASCALTFSIPDLGHGRKELQQDGLLNGICHITTSQAQSLQSLQAGDREGQRDESGEPRRERQKSREGGKREGRTIQRKRSSVITSMLDAPGALHLREANLGKPSARMFHYE